MNKKALIKISLFSLTLALSLSFVALLFMNRFMSIQGARFRDDFLRFFAESLEVKISSMSLEQIRNSKDLFEMGRDFRPPMPPREDMPPHPGLMPPPPPPPRPGDGPGFRPPKRFEAWLVGENGLILNSENQKPLPKPWSALPKPATAKEIASTENFFRLGAPVLVFKLEAPQRTLYLVIQEPNRPLWGPLIITQALMTTSTIIVALILAMASLFFYLRRKSLEARSVLRRLESGDLKARFEIQRLDEFGELMLDFNRMAEEIEKLVGRIHATERTRKQLLQEMGHDLRTPLTSLKTSFETLQVHHSRLSEQDKNQLFDVLIREIDYFKDLIEQLMTIASLDEPHFKTSTETIKVMDLVNQEIQHRQSGDTVLEWHFHAQTLGLEDTILGDSHLIRRLLRNGLENAARYANSRVDIFASSSEGLLRLEICDDGSGLDPDALVNFGNRREFRGRKITKNGHYSLGLGSVIMKAIAELHNGSVIIENITQDGKTKGARLIIKLPLK